MVSIPRLLAAPGRTLPLLTSVAPPSLSVPLPCTMPPAAFVSGVPPVSSVAPLAIPIVPVLEDSVPVFKVPALTSTVPALLNEPLKTSALVPPLIFVTVAPAALLNSTEPPLLLSHVCAFWMLNDAPARLLKVVVPEEDVRTRAAPVQFTVPELLNVPGCNVSWVVLLSVAIAPVLTLNTATESKPSPSVAVPPEGIVTLPVPASVPDRRFRLGIEAAPLKFAVPPLIVVVPETL